MPLCSCQRRVEHAHQHEVFGLAAAQIVLVVFVQNIDVARLDRMAVALHVLDFPLAGDAVAGFQMVAVFEFGFGACVHDGVAYGEPHPVGAGEQAMACAVSPIDKKFTCLDIAKASDKHCFSSPVLLSAGKLRLKMWRHK